MRSVSGLFTVCFSSETKKTTASSTTKSCPHKFTQFDTNVKIYLVLNQCIAGIRNGTSQLNVRFIQYV